MAKKQKENFLDYIPKHNSLFESNKNEAAHVEIKVANKGLFNRIAQIFFKRPKYSQIELDDFGTFIWESIDGEKTIYEIGQKISRKFGEAAEPLYPRLVQFVKVLHQNSFIIYMNKIKQKNRT